MTDLDDRLTIKTAATAKFTRVKFVDEEQRVIEGTASTPVTDRAGDIVESLGAEFVLPVPLLLDHRSDQNVGEVFEARVTSKGIRFKARIAKIDKPGAAQDLTNYAWDLVKSGLRKTVSIGFRGLETEVMSNGGLRFKTWELLEISLVSNPANPQALIESIKGDPDSLPPPRRTVPTVPVVPAPAIVVDTKAIEMRDITGRLHDLGKARKRYATRKWQVIGAERDAMDAAIKTVDAETERLIARQVAIETGINIQTKEVPQQHTAQAWEIRNRPEPSLAGLDVNQVLAAHPDLLDHYIDVVAKMMSDIDCGPNALVSRQEAAVTDASMMSTLIQLRAITRLFDKRLSDLEANQQKFAGVYQRSLPYRKGNLVVNAGSMWCALKDAPEGAAPGADAETWQLAVKQGDVR